MVDVQVYTVKEAGSIASPALLYYSDIIAANTAKAIEMAGGADRLIPHVKSHKMREVVLLQMAAGITKFKCATIAEAEMVASCGGSQVVLAYPLVGPNIDRFVALRQAFPACEFYAIGDDPEQLHMLGKASQAKSLAIRALIDVDMGMHRTGIAPERIEHLYRELAAQEGIRLEGLHCYDGHNSDSDPIRRKALTEQCLGNLLETQKRLRADGFRCDIMILGGTPSFQVYRTLPDVWLSPGTLFVQDHGYQEKYPDLPFTPGAAILTRVVSHPQPDTFTLDCGTKAIAADPATRGVIAGFPEVTSLFQSEEHWVFRMKEGTTASRPPIGAVLYVIPTHICPTSALYSEAVVVANGTVAGNWEVTARNRKITI